MATLTSPTIEDLLTNVRNMLGQPSATNSTWTDEELTAYLNEAVRRYFVRVVQEAEGQFTTTANLDITSGSETIALPTDCFEIKNVWRAVSDGYEPLFYRNNVTEGYISTDASSGSGYRPGYYFRGNSLVLNPTPNFSETSGIRIEYVQFPTTMLTGGDSMTSQVSPVFRDLVEMYAVYKAKLKESLSNGTNTYAAAKDNLNDLYTAFEEVIVGRSFSPTAIQPFNPEDL